jgi:type I restriction enzyme R subunit
VAEFEPENGPADYALCLSGQVVGIIEAKKLTLRPQNVLTQALRYSRGIEPRAPFLYSTNGKVIWHCSISEQREIIRRTNHLFAVADRVERGLMAAERQVSAILPSLPNRDFRGSLSRQKQISPLKRGANSNRLRSV